MALKQERNYGVDLLRIVSMFMVVLLHVLMHGGVLQTNGAFSAQYLLSWFMEYAARCAVNLFALISGYVGIKSRYRVSNLAVLWLQVFFYSFGIAVFAAIVRPAYVSGLRNLAGYAFPVLTDKYWYFSAYVCLFLFMPLLNKGVDALSERSLRRLVLAMFLVFSVAEAIARETSHNPFALQGGFSGLWLMILYVAGGYIAKHGMWKKVPQPALIGIWLGCAAVSLGIRVAVRQISAKLTGAPFPVTALLNYDAPLIVLESVALLLFFARLRCGNVAKKLIAFFAPTIFGIFIIHRHPIIWEHLIHKRFSFIADFSPLALVGAVFLSAVGIFVVCILIELLRIQLFKLLKVKQRCLALEERLFRKDGAEKEES